MHRETGGRLPIIGVGGIMTADDAARMFDAGASLVQLYTGFIYHGPAPGPRRRHAGPGGRTVTDEVQKGTFYNARPL